MGPVVLQQYSIEPVVLAKEIQILSLSLFHRTKQHFNKQTFAGTVVFVKGLYSRRGC